MHYEEIFEHPLQLYSNIKRNDIEKKLNECLRKDPDDPKLLYYSGLLLLNKNKYRESVAALERSIKINSDYLPSFFCLISIFIEIREYSNAEKYINYLKEKLPEGDFWEVDNKKAELLIARRRIKECEKLLESSILKHPRVPELHRNLGISYFEKKDYHTAKSHFQNALNIKSSDLQTLYYLSAVYLILGDSVTAGVFLDQLPSVKIPEVFERVCATRELTDDHILKLRRCKTEIQRELDQGSHQSDLLYSIATICFIENDLQMAHDYLMQSLEVDSCHVKSYWLLATIHREEKRFNEVEVILAEVEKNNIEHIQWFIDFHSALNCCADNRFIDGLKILEGAIQSYSDNANLFLLKGQMQMSINDFTEAVKSIEIAIDLDPFLYQAHVFLAISNRSLGRVQTALQILEKLPQYIDQRIISSIYAEKRICYEKIGNLDLWKEEVLKAIELDMFSIDLLKKLGEEFEIHKDYNISLKCMSKILQKNSNYHFSIENR